MSVVMNSWSVCINKGNDSFLLVSSSLFHASLWVGHGGLG